MSNIYVEEWAPGFKRPTPYLIQIFSSAGGKLPDVNNKNFYKVIKKLIELENEYPSFIDEPLLESEIRETDWNALMYH